MKLLLLPGMDGTPDLLAGFMAALPADLHAVIAEYPADRVTTYRDLLELVARTAPEGDFVVVAESYSTPLPVLLAESGLTAGLRGVVICAGFATCPVRGWRKWVARLVGAWTFRLHIPNAFVKWLLVGFGASSSELAEVAKRAVGKVSPVVMAARVREVLRCDVLAELSRIKVPVLVMRAGQDHLVSPKCTQEMLAVKSMESVVIDGPHLLLHREPELCAQILQDWIVKLGD